MARQYVVSTPNGPVVVNETGKRQYNMSNVTLSESQDNATTPIVAVRRRSTSLIAS